MKPSLPSHFSCPYLNNHRTPMKQILQNLKNGNTEITEVPSPSVSRGRLLIQTRNTLISAGTEKMLVEFGQAGLIGKAKAQPEKVKQVIDKIKTDGLLPTLESVFAKLGEPLPLGYCNAGKVVEVGSGVTGFEVGDRVISNGPHAEVVSVPKLLCAKIPDNVSDEHASFTVLSSIALQGIRLVKPTLGETVVVYGLGLIGLITVQLLRASGCRVIGIDINESRLKLAQEFGADVINGKETNDVVALANSYTSHEGVDAVVITASAKTNQIVSDAANMCRKRGRIVLVGVVGLELNRNELYEKEISFQVSCSYGPGRYDSSYEQTGNDYPRGFVRWTEQRNFEAILLMMKTGQLDVGALITHRYEISAAKTAYDIVQNQPESLGVVLEYTDGDRFSKTLRLHESNRENEPQDVVPAIIGAGNFTAVTLLPAIKSQPEPVEFIAGRSNGAAVQHLASKFGCRSATTDTEQVFESDRVNLVMVTTNHDSHANLVVKALEKGKNIFVEKPLCLNEEELATVIACRSQYCEPMLTVGFNRRYSPHIKRCTRLLKGRAEPVSIQILVNAGAIPSDHWVHHPEKGGGRIIGEACHFIDLLVHITESKVKSISASRVGGTAAIRDDKMSIVCEMEDGSIGSINYLANGSKKFPKETIHVFSEERIFECVNFRTSRAYGFVGFQQHKTRRLEKGHPEQFAALYDAVRQGKSMLIPFEELVNVSLASFAAVRSAHERRTIDIATEFKDVIAPADTVG